MSKARLAAAVVLACGAALALAQARERGALAQKAPARARQPDTK